MWVPSMSEKYAVVVRSHYLIVSISITYLQSWTKVLGHVCISGAFSNSHRSNLSPHRTNNVGPVYTEIVPSFNFV